MVLHGGGTDKSAWRFAMDSAHNRASMKTWKRGLLVVTAALYGRNYERDREVVNTSAVNSKRYSIDRSWNTYAGTGVNEKSNASRPKKFPLTCCSKQQEEKSTKSSNSDVDIGSSNWLLLIDMLLVCGIVLLVISLYNIYKSIRSKHQYKSGRKEEAGCELTLIPSYGTINQRDSAQGTTVF